MSQSFGKYRVLEKLGQGAMGVVYKAWDNSLNRVVALKTMAASLSTNPELKARFDREARAAAQLQHPNIITIFELGEIEGQVYIAMEFIQGKSFREVLGKPAPLERQLDILIQICRALHYAHQHGIVHRDIKPSNIYLTGDGTVKILDFGIAHLADSELTQTGSTIGTPEYMSPEQVKGLKVDGRSDGFSCGVVFYEFLTGSKPFHDDSIATVLSNIISKEPPPVSSLWPECPPLLDRVVSRLLAKQPENRYRDLAGVADELTEFQSDLFLRRAEKVRELKRCLQESQELLERPPFSAPAEKILEQRFGGELEKLRHRLRWASHPSDPSVSVELVAGELEKFEAVREAIRNFVSDELRPLVAQHQDRLARLEKSLGGDRLAEAETILRQLEPLLEQEEVDGWQQRILQREDELAARERNRRREEFLAAARKLQAEGASRAALGHVEEALALDPESEEALELQSELQQRIRREAASSSPTRLKTPPPSPAADRAGEPPPPGSFTPAAPLQVSPLPPGRLLSPPAQFHSQQGDSVLNELATDFFSRAELSFRSGDLQAARHNLERVLQVDPQHGAALDLREQLETMVSAPAKSDPGRSHPSPSHPRLQRRSRSAVPWRTLGAAAAVLVCVWLAWTALRNGAEQEPPGSSLPAQSKLQSLKETGAYKLPAALPALLTEIEGIRSAGAQEEADRFLEEIKSFYAAEAESYQKSGDRDSALRSYRVLTDLLRDSSFQSRIDELSRPSSTQPDSSAAGPSQPAGPPGTAPRPELPSSLPDLPPSTAPPTAQAGLEELRDKLDQAVERGELAEAAGLIRAIEERTSLGARELFYKAWTLTRSQPDQARELLQQSLKMEEKNAPAHLLLGVLHRSAGESSPAVQHLSRALSLGTLSEEEAALARSRLQEFSYDFPVRHVHPGLEGDRSCSGTISLIQRAVIRYSTEETNHSVALGIKQVVKSIDLEPDGLKIQLRSGRIFNFAHARPQDRQALERVLFDFWAMTANRTDSGYQILIR